MSAATSAPLTRARIVPFDTAGRAPEEANAVLFDFNPETLTLKTSAGQSRDRARQGRQQVQHVGAAQATLSFEAVFDATRPREGATNDADGQPERLDVRLRTRPLALLIQADPTSQRGGGGGGKNKKPAPRRVQFRWGSIVFNGLITQYQETFDFFSPEGVPLRSKVQVTLTEQEFRYEIDSNARAQQAASAPAAPGGLRDAAAAAGADSLTDLAGGGFSLGLDASFSAGFSAGVSLSAELGVSADIGLSVGAGISLDASASLDLFGPPALGGAGAGAGGGGALGKAALTPAPAPRAPAPPGPWAPDGPAPGSQAAGLAAVVAGQRAAGLAFAAPNAGRPPAGGAPPAPVALAVRGAPPPVLPRAPGGAAPPALRRTPAETAWDGTRRPRWEASTVTALPTRGAAAHTQPCGCRRCGGGG
jgi:hypothetical protein